MFDIFQFVREKIFRKKPLQNISPEEISEKKTTKMWNFLLFCMFLAMISTSFWSLNIISDILDRPERPSYELQKIVDILDKEGKNDYISDYEINNEIDFSDENLQKNFEKAKIILKNLGEISSEKNNFETEIINTQYHLKNLEQDYELALTEKIANVSDNIDKIKEKIDFEKEKIKNLDLKISELDKKIFSIKSENFELYEIFFKENENQLKKYEKDYLIFKLTRAILSLLFVLTFFLIFNYFYVKHKIKNSPFTIIFSVASFAYSLVLLYLMLNFLWEIIPESLLDLIFKFFENFSFIWYFLQFLWPIFIVWFFGFFVYKIQKRIYSKENILKRIIKDKKCPNCGSDVDITKPFCCICGNEILEKCENCGDLTIKWMKYCYNCWKEKS